MEFIGIKKLAAHIFMQALNDYRKHSEGQTYEFYSPSTRKKQEIINHSKNEQRKLFHWLTNNSFWHEVLGLEPEYVKRKLISKELDFNLIRSYASSLGGKNNTQRIKMMIE